MELNRYCVDCWEEVWGDDDLCEECYNDTIDWEDLRVDEFIEEQQYLKEKEKERENGNQNNK